MDIEPNKGRRGHRWQAGEVADKEVMLTLSIRQPYAELILRGVKTIEYRSRATRIIGERFDIYASKKSAIGGPPATKKKKVWSAELTSEKPAEWMLELAQLLILGDLPTGVIVGSAVIEKVTPPENKDGLYYWHLADVQRAKMLRQPTGHPQPVWWRAG